MWPQSDGWTGCGGSWSKVENKHIVIHSRNKYNNNNNNSNNGSNSRKSNNSNLMIIIVFLGWLSRDEVRPY